MKLLVYSTHVFDKPFLEKAAQGKHTISFTEKPLSEDSTTIAKGYDAVALFTGDKAGKTELTKLSELGIKYIALRSVGYDHVDLPTALELGIKVANVPEYSPYSVAEHAVTLLLAFNRKLVASQELFKVQDFRLDTLTGFDIKGKTVGIIGTGKIGVAFAAIMKGFGCKILAYDPKENKDALALGVHYVALDKLLSESRIISIHCPLNASTKHLIGKKELQQLQKNTILINTARGGIIDTPALVEALENQQFAGACLDVYEFEKGLYFQDLRNTEITDSLFKKLRSLPNVLLTGHQAFLTQEALEGIAQTTMKNLSEWEQNGECSNELAPH